LLRRVSATQRLGEKRHSRTRSYSCHPIARYIPYLLRFCVAFRVFCWLERSFDSFVVTTFTFVLSLILPTAVFGCTTHCVLATVALRSHFTTTPLIWSVRSVDSRSVFVSLRAFPLRFLYRQIFVCAAFCVCCHALRLLRFTLIPRSFRFSSVPAGFRLVQFSSLVRADTTAVLVHFAVYLALKRSLRLSPLRWRLSCEKSHYFSADHRFFFFFRCALHADCTVAFGFGFSTVLLVCTLHRV